MTAGSQSVAKARPAIKQDRPSFHIAPPKGWLNGERADRGLALLSVTRPSRRTAETFVCPFLLVVQILTGLCSTPATITCESTARARARRARGEGFEERGA